MKYAGRSDTTAESGSQYTFSLRNESSGRYNEEPRLCWRCRYIFTCTCICKKKKIYIYNEFTCTCDTSVNLQFEQTGWVLELHVV